jgi:hypothetical protein
MAFMKPPKRIAKRSKKLGKQQKSQKTMKGPIGSFARKLGLGKKKK